MTLRFYRIFAATVLFIHAIDLKAKPCADLITQFEPQQIQLGELTRTIWSPLNYQVLDVSEFFGESDVFLGITRNGHFYLQLGNVRHEGGFFPIPTQTTNGRNFEGYLIHFPTLSRKDSRSGDKLYSPGFKGFSWSCSSSACTTLKKEFGIKIADTTLPAVFSGPTLKKILSRGFVDDSGAPLEMSLYKTSFRVPDLGTLQAHLDAQDVKYGAISALLLIEVSTMSLFFIFSFTESPGE